MLTYGEQLAFTGVWLKYNSVAGTGESTYPRYDLDVQNVFMIVWKAKQCWCQVDGVRREEGKDGRSFSPYKYSLQRKRDIGNGEGWRKGGGGGKINGALHRADPASTSWMAVRGHINCFLKNNRWSRARRPKAIRDWTRWWVIWRFRDVYFSGAFGGHLAQSVTSPSPSRGPRSLARDAISFFVSLRLTSLICKCPRLPTSRNTSSFICPLFPYIIYNS